MTSAASPSVTANPYGYAFTVVWSDGRFGSAEIFGRMWIPYFKEWHDEMRLTNRSTSCLRPSVHAEFCCGDLGYPMAMVVFEGDTLAVPEVYGLVFTDGGPEAMAPISVIDGQPSVLPNIHGFWFSSDGPFGGGTRKYFVTWTDQILTTKINRHCLALLVEEPYAPEDTLIFSQTGMPGSAVRGIEGFPDAEVMILWVEPVGPSAVLLSRRGTLPGKTSVEDPEPATAVRVAAVTPNPAESIVTIRIGTDGVAELTVCVVDVTGRMVRNLDRFEISSYRTTVIWDTRDDAGREVAPGAYFVRVEWDGRHDDKAIHVIR